MFQVKNYKDLKPYQKSVATMTDLKMIKELNSNSVGTDPALPYELPIDPKITREYELKI